MSDWEKYEDEKERRRRERRRTAFIAGFCSMVTGLTMTYIAFVLGTQVATFRVQYTPAQPSAALGTATTAVPVRTTGDCSSKRTAMMTYIQKLYGTDGRTASLDSVLKDPGSGDCLYEATVHWKNSRGTGVSWLLEDYDTGRRIVVQDAVDGDPLYSKHRADYERRVNNYLVAAATPK